MISKINLDTIYIRVKYIFYVKNPNFISKYSMYTPFEQFTISILYPLHMFNIDVSLTTLSVLTIVIIVS
jgi:hypothetical protein